jgi:hypothetical protein
VSEERPEQLPEVKHVLLSTAISLVNLAGIRLTDKKDLAQAKEAIDAARAVIPLCPEEEVGPIQEALSQVQMLYVKETQSPAEPPAADADERAKARAKIWTPPGS